jgi:hypothetical protein
VIRRLELLCTESPTVRQRLSSFTTEELVELALHLGDTGEGIAGRRRVVLADRVIERLRERVGDPELDGAKLLVQLDNVRREIGHLAAA